MNSASLSSDFFAFDNISFHGHSSSDTVSSDGGRDFLFFSDPYPFPLYTGSAIDIAQENSIIQNPLDETLPSLDPFSPSFFPFSPPNPSTHLENQTLYYRANLVQPPLSSGPNLETEFGRISASSNHRSEVKSEECKMGADYYAYNQQFLPHSYSGSENVSKFMQRSFSCNSFDGKPNFLFQAPCDTVMDSPLNFQSQALSSPENSFFAGQVRRACSTGDLQNMKGTHTSQSEGSFLVEANFKVGRYSAEERKERISKYRAKRRQRNFNRTIKYACRKTLADNRTRIRGRFARNDETSEIPKAPCSNRDEDDDEFWIELAEGLNM